MAGQERRRPLKIGLQLPEIEYVARWRELSAMARRADRHHAQLLVDAAGRSVLHRFLDAWLPQVEALPEARRVRWALDVDPLELF